MHCGPTIIPCPWPQHTSLSLVIQQDELQENSFLAYMCVRTAQLPMLRAQRRKQQHMADWVGAQLVRPPRLRNKKQHKQ